MKTKKLRNNNLKKPKENDKDLTYEQILNRHTVKIIGECEKI